MLTGSVLRAIMNKAGESELGIEVPVETEGAAISLRQRLYRLRSDDKKAMQKRGLDPESHPWNPLVITIPKGPPFKIKITTEDELLKGLEIIDIATGTSLGKAAEFAPEAPLAELPFGEVDKTNE